MEKLLDKINKDIKTAMKEKDASKLSVLRMALASLKNKKIELKQDDFLSNKQVISVIQSEVKKRKGPNRDWLKFVKTRRAKDKIRQATKASKLEQIKRMIPGI